MKHVAVLGAGESGLGAALLAKSRGLRVFVSDYGGIDDRYKDELVKNSIPFEEGGHSFEKLEKADVIVKSPGIPDTSEAVRFFRLRHKKIISEIEFASRFYDGRIIGITGSNGKTTTTTLCHHILKHSDSKVGMGGNVGISFARLLTLDTGYDWVVLELSSFQLENIQDYAFDISVVLNITPDHLDRYDYIFDKYAAAKWNIVRNTKEEGKVLLNSDNEAVRRQFDLNPPLAEVIWIEGDGGKIPVSKDTGNDFEMRLKGSHNRFNASVCIVLARLFGMDDTKIQSALLSFKDVPHRLEMVGQTAHHVFVNDSKATNIDSSRMALDAFAYPIAWIAGGTDKGNDYSELNDLVEKGVAAIICLTADDSKLKAAFESRVKHMYTTRDVEDAVRKAIEYLPKGGTILLSPACASFDLFKNYEHRGDSFKRAVEKILNERN